MGIDKQVLTELVKVARSNAKPRKVEGTDLVAYDLDDMSIVFSAKNNTFYGLIVEVLGRDFHISADLSLMIDDENDENMEESVYRIEDERIIKFFNDFLKIRTNLLETFGA